MIRSNGSDRNRFDEKFRNRSVYGSSARTLLTVFFVCAIMCSGCLSVNPSVQASTNDSTVFKEITVDEPWASNNVWVDATFRRTPAAGNVTSITVIRENGQPFSTQQIASGQTNVALALPTNQDATLVASDTVNGTTIEKLNVTIR